jgi:hypothetical protein
MRCEEMAGAESSELRNSSGLCAMWYGRTKNIGLDLSRWCQCPSNLMSKDCGDFWNGWLGVANFELVDFHDVCATRSRGGLPLVRWTSRVVRLFSILVHEQWNGRSICISVAVIRWCSNRVS